MGRTTSLRFVGLVAVLCAASGCHRSHEGPPLGPYDAGPPWNGEGVGVLSEWPTDHDVSPRGGPFAVSPAGVVYWGSGFEVYSVTEGTFRVHVTQDDLTPLPPLPGRGGDRTTVRINSIAVDSDGLLYLALGDGRDARIDVSRAPHEVSPLFVPAEPRVPPPDGMAVLTPSELLLADDEGLWLVSPGDTRRLWEWEHADDDDCRSSPQWISVRGDTVYTLAWSLGRRSLDGSDHRCLVRRADVTPDTEARDYYLGGVAAHPAGGVVLYVEGSLYRVQDDGSGFRIETEPDLATRDRGMWHDVGVDRAGRIYMRRGTAIYRIAPPG